MNATPPITSSELAHCGRFCFNDGVCIGCYRDIFGLAQCLGCLCPTKLWTGERCELRIGTVSYSAIVSPLNASFVLAWVFGILTVLLCGILALIYFQKRRSALFAFRMSQLQESSYDPSPLPVPISTFPLQPPVST
ncbi:unnamed protein product [Schistocephalus solidus]|uniref:EGF-like domain-containing protein n=1 Tax=Schistocephalus solidus TaxID=70667 RepID=A0A183T8C6_SCHSO|nr:unnamed protein product [Schistocephalus solidus]